MTGQQIITKFQLYTGDQSELSSTEELDLLNKVYDDVLNARPWEFLKKGASGAITVSGSEAYITMPSDFRYFIENNQKTDNSDVTYNNASQKVVYVGASYTPYQVVNWSDRRRYIGQQGYCYPDYTNRKIIFTAIPNELTYDFDYIYQWTALATNTSPIFPADFHDMLFHLMAVDSTIINLFEKARSYSKENQDAADAAMRKLVYYNSMLTFN